jgi:hypothetical protein
LDCKLPSSNCKVQNGRCGECSTHRNYIPTEGVRHADALARRKQTARRPRTLRNYLRCHVAMHVGQAEIAAGIAVG